MHTTWDGSINHGLAGGTLVKNGSSNGEKRNRRTYHDALKGHAHQSSVSMQCE